MTQLTPFADNATSTAVGELTIENGIDSVSVYGRLDIGRDQRGLAQARQLRNLLERIVGTLEAQLLPAEAPALAAAVARTVRNPFG